MDLKTAWKSLCLLVIFLAVTCRGVTGQQKDPWTKLNSRPVCFGAKDNQYGSFSFPYGRTHIAGIKLVHLTGYLKCSRFSSFQSIWSFWGCDTSSRRSLFNVVITKSSNEVILPPVPLFSDGSRYFYDLPGYNSLSSDIVLPFFNPYSVSPGQKLRLWYGRDLADHALEKDNEGRVCCDVYALYI